MASCLVLNPEVPRILSGRFQVRIDRKKALIEILAWKDGVLRIVGIGERISSRIICIRVIETKRSRTCESLADIDTKWCDGTSVFVDVHPDRIVRNPRPDADDGFAGACRVPGDSQTRFKVVPLIVHAGLTVDTFVSDI